MASTITINGTQCEFDGKPMILQVALANGLAIPHYCYHEGLSIVASCRICLAEVWAENPKTGDLEPIPRLLPTCQTPAGNGTIVYTNSPKAIANQKAVMEYLLINHPLDCPVCDQAGECFLQDYSYEYGRSESRFQEDKIKQAKKDVGPHVWLYSDRCIMCSRCVRFTREVTGTGELCVVGRGAYEQIDVFPGMALENDLSGNVVDICPVGALLDKDFLFQQRVWLLTKAPSIDGLTASGDNIFLEHNEGRIWRVKPRRNLDVNKWWISDEIRYGWKFIHSESRLTTPTRVQYGERVGTTWETALQEIDKAMRNAAKSDAPIAALVSPMLPCEEAYLIGKYLRTWRPTSPGKVILGVGPVPVSGADKTYPPGAKPGDARAYTIRAEKAPNARGVRRVLTALNAAAGIATPPPEFADFLKAVKDATVVFITGNYPSEWVTDELVRALARKVVIAIDTLPNKLTAKADIVLPAATWAEKAGTFENVNGRLQAFEPAIAPLEDSRPEGRIMLDLIALADVEGDSASTRAAARARYDAAAIRAEIAVLPGLTDFAAAVHFPAVKSLVESDMELVPI